jgi:PAS domain S-box-containing protein
MDPVSTASAIALPGHAQLRQILEHTSAAVFVKDLEGRLLFANQEFERLKGMPLEAIVGRLDAELFPDATPEIRLNDRRIIEERRALDFEETVNTAQGRRIYLSHKFPLLDAQGNPYAVCGIATDITDRKRIEDALRTSEEQYRAIFNATADALVLWNSQLERVDVNPAFERLYGITREEALLSTYPRDLPAEAVKRRIEIVQRTLAGESCQEEIESVRRNGEPLRIEVRTIRIHHRGEPHVLAIIRDVTERRHAEQAILASEQRLRASESRYRLLFEMESDAIVVTDARTLEILDANRAAERLWGYSREELMHLKATDLSAEKEATRSVHQDSHDSARVPLRWHRKKDGTLFPVEISLNHFTLEGREVALSAIRDIAERREREDALARSEGRLRATFEAAFDCVIGMDGRGNLIEFNAAAERIFGFRREDVLGRPLAGLLIPAGMRNAHEEGLARFRETRQGPYIGNRIETTALRADGSEFPVELAISVARAGDDDLFIGYLRDISERKEAERRRSELEAQLRQTQKMEAIGHLTGGIAHDFNNLLTSIMGYVTLATERSSDARLAGYLDQASLSCARARDLIQQMLTFSRGQRGEPRPLALSPQIRDSIKLLRSSLPSTVSLSADLDDEAPPVLLDPVQLDQVLMNFAINARDATRSSGAIRIAVHQAGWVSLVCTSCRKDIRGEMVELSVADDGPGIAAEVRERMFEPFFTTKEVGQGSGMGLATVHGIVHEHGGHIVVDSTPGKGATFRVLLPALQAPGTAARPRRATEPAFPRATLSGKVAVIDDEESVARFMRDLLAHWDLQAATFADGRAVLDAIESGETFDLVLTDQTMPRMTGIDLAREVRVLRRDLPIVLYSGYTEKIDPAEARRAGVTALICKPIDPGTLLALLRQHLAPTSR